MQGVTARQNKLYTDAIDDFAKLMSTEKIMDKLTNNMAMWGAAYDNFIVTTLTGWAFLGIGTSTKGQRLEALPNGI